MVPYDNLNDNSSARPVCIHDNAYGTEILRIIPTGLSARLAFHELAQMKIEPSASGAQHKLDAHHAQFIHIEGKASLLEGEGYDSGSGATPTEDETPADDSIYRGYYRLSLTAMPFTLGTKWVLGKGVRENVVARNVDILLAAPGSKQRRGISAAHAFLRMHPQSGAWMIRAGTICNTKNCTGVTLIPSEDAKSLCNHEPVFLNNMRLRHGESRALTRPRTTIVLGGLHFLIQICVSTIAKEVRYLEEREVFLRGCNLPPLANTVSGVPFEADILTPFALFRRGLGSGGFGSVFDGYDPHTGDPRAVKRLQVTNKHRKRDIQQEIQSNVRFTGHDGIVKCFGWCNASGEANLEGQMPFDMFLIQEKGISFLDYDWGKEGADWELRGRLCQQLLFGVHIIHSAGCMHRDITPMNILYFPDEPKHAALCDFGKLHDFPTDTDTALAAWQWLPPEVENQRDPQRRRRYDQKIDVFMLALALVCSWFPAEIPKKQLTLVTHAEIVTMLKSNSTKQPLMSRGLADLLLRMLEWDPKNRCTAREALQTPIFQSPASIESYEQITSTIDRKRSHE